MPSFKENVYVFCFCLSCGPKLQKQQEAGENFEEVNY